LAGAEVENTHSEATMVYLKILFSHLFGGAGENHEKPFSGQWETLSVHGVL
jgi:hypothetical protein